MKSMQHGGWDYVVDPRFLPMEPTPDQRDLADYVVAKYAKLGFRATGTLWFPFEVLVILAADNGTHAYLRLPAKAFPDEDATCILQFGMGTSEKSKRFVWGGEVAEAAAEMRREVNALAAIRPD